MRQKKSAYAGLFDGALLPDKIYRGLIEEGSAEIVRNVSAAIKSGHFSHFNIDISGGRDFEKESSAAVLRSGYLYRCGP